MRFLELEEEEAIKTERPGPITGGCQVVSVFSGFWTGGWILRPWGVESRLRLLISGDEEGDGAWRAGSGIRVAGGETILSGKGKAGVGAVRGAR